MNSDTHLDILENFTDALAEHIENYAIPQYGEVDQDLISKMEPADCILQVQKYAARFGKNQRTGQEELDLLKMAIYIMRAWDKTVNGET